ncbi:DUF2505 domain-containing protein [Actinotignum timonense]|uniref:DUF2505 domain-containing protein n=1 Tax=Actinotignum TaxID=1653174 RepID=UPI00254FAA2E|nr:DUF2505 domain-containing protein [Actinotignum timonense]MDK6907267.1 DUF2505 domain-containing protein [Actinotignum timonense]MDK8783036.1 DUF2505 domain-containing protein [Actinotignum timonense]
MQFSHTYEISAPASAVATVLMSEELANRRLAALHTQPSSFTPGAERAVMTVQVSADQLPAQARRFLSSGLAASIVFTRSGNDVAAQLEAKLPVHASADFQVSGSGPATVTVTGEVRVSIPFVGKKIEEKVAQYAAKVVERDAALIREITAQG